MFHISSCPAVNPQHGRTLAQHYEDILLQRKGVPVKGASIEIKLPPEVEQYAGDLRRFFEAMVYKLGVHSSKGRWEDMPIDQALELLRGEEKELTEAVERGNMVEIMLESADVANYALITSAIAMERGK